jgi:hypothetical protein
VTRRGRPSRGLCRHRGRELPVPVRTPGGRRPGVGQSAVPVAGRSCLSTRRRPCRAGSDAGRCARAPCRCRCRGACAPAPMPGACPVSAPRTGRPGARQRAVPVADDPPTHRAGAAIVRAAMPGACPSPSAPGGVVLALGGALSPRGRSSRAPRRCRCRAGSNPGQRARPRPRRGRLALDRAPPPSPATDAGARPFRPHRRRGVALGAELQASHDTKCALAANSLMRTHPLRGAHDW